MRKIDLHLHTQKCKQGDGNGRNISVEEFIEKMKSNRIGVCAITNHNKFDIEEHHEIIKKEPELLVFPGIELDVKFSEGIKHIILICNPDSTKKFHEEFSNDKDRDYDTYNISYDNFINKVIKFEKNEIIIIPHFLDKDKKRALNLENKEKLKKDLKKYIVILETSKLQSMGIINAHNEISLIGSDIKDWKNYEEAAKSLPELKFSIDSFGKFYELASDSKLFIKTALNGCTKYKVEIKDREESIEIYEDVNIIFGEKGSGKTILLKNYVYPEIKKLGKKVFLHEGKNYEKSYNEIIENTKKSVNVDLDLKKETISLIKKIFTYKENAIDNFIDRYIKYYHSETTNKNAQIIKKTETSYNKNTSSSVSEKIGNVYTDIKSIDKTKKINEEFRSENPTRGKLLTDELEILREEKKRNTLITCSEIFVTDKTNNILNGFKEILDKKVGKKSKPNNIGFSKLVSERKKYIEEIKKIKGNFEEIKECKIVKLGEVPNKGDINLKVSIRVLSQSEKYILNSPFERNKITKNREFIEKIYGFSIEEFMNINEYFNNEVQEKSENEYFNDCVKKESIVIRSNGELYEPSEGEKSILSISGVLENHKYDCYLFDEIERGLGNKYISDYIIPHIKSLRDMGKIVVVSTHNANIAISTLPSQTLYCNYKGNIEEEIYYSGNMYSNELLSLKDKDNILKWEEKALKHLEGSKEMFGIRRNIWNLKS